MKNSYVREKSNLGRQNLNVRSTSKTGYNQRQNSSNRPWSTNRPGGNDVRSVSKSFEGPKRELYKKIETIERRFEKFEKVQNEMKEIFKKMISTQFLE